MLPEGDIREELTRYAIDTEAEMMVIGRPTRSPGRNVFKIAGFDDFVADLEEKAQLKIVKAPAEQQDS